MSRLENIPRSSSPIVNPCFHRLASRQAGYATSSSYRTSLVKGSQIALHARCLLQQELHVYRRKGKSERSSFTPIQLLESLLAQC